MRYSLATLALAGVALAIPAPNAKGVATPAGCSQNYAGQFEIQVVNVTSSSKRSLLKRQDNNDITLVLTLANGILTDSQNRQGYIASNNQFQFNTPVQSNALATSGFSVCSNGSLALNSAIWWECLSGTFYNLYDASIGGQCNQVYIDVIPISGSTTGTATTPGGTPTGVASEQSDGQPTASPVSSPVCEYIDGQPQQGCVPVCEYTDGQPQQGCTTPTPTSAVCEYVDGQPQEGCSTAPAPTPTSAVCEYVDGQPQEGCSTTPAPTPTSAVCEYVDGQPQEGCSTTPAPAPSSAVCEYVDGQPQEGCSTTATPTSAVCEYVDGQPQQGCPTTAVAAATSVSIQPATGAAAMATALPGDLFGLAAGVLALAML